MGRTRKDWLRKRKKAVYKGFTKELQAETKREAKHRDGTYSYFFKCPSCVHDFKHKPKTNYDGCQGGNQEMVCKFPKVEFIWDCPFCNKTIVVFCKRSMQHHDWHINKNII